MSKPVRVKICGVTTVSDALTAVDCGASAIGLNFYEGSPRFISAQTAKEIVSALPPFVEPVGVFVKKTPAEVTRILGEMSRVYSFQIHGAAPETVRTSPFRYIPTFQVRNREDVTALAMFAERARLAFADLAAVLVDGYAPGMVGGTGRPAPWDLLAGVQFGYPLILAGGLTPENVAEAIRQVGPYAVDVASGVESTPGRKDPSKVKAFIQAALAATA